MAAVRAMFPGAAARTGMYESFFLRAVSPREPAGAWIRYTVLKRPGAAPRGSLWLTAWRPGGGRPFQHKLTGLAPSVPDGGWIALAGGAFAPQLARGSCGEASFSLRLSEAEGALAHLAPELLYRAPLPRTKLTSPAPRARFDGCVQLPGDSLGVEAWVGMVGHNWGAEHAERWIWLHGTAFAGRPDAWLDLALGRVRVGRRTTPWVANGALSIGGRRYRLGGLRGRPRVRETPEECTLALGGEGGLRLQAQVSVPPAASAGWRYSDPDGGEHDVLNCSIAALELDARLPDGSRVQLATPHGAAYELGLRERDHGVPIAPFGEC